MSSEPVHQAVPHSAHATLDAEDVWAALPGLSHDSLSDNEFVDVQEVQQAVPTSVGEVGEVVAENESTEVGFTEAESPAGGLQGEHGDVQDWTMNDVATSLANIGMFDDDSEGSVESAEDERAQDLEYECEHGRYDDERCESESNCSETPAASGGVPDRSGLPERSPAAMMQHLETLARRMSRKLPKPPTLDKVSNLPPPPPLLPTGPLDISTEREEDESLSTSRSSLKLSPASVPIQSTGYRDLPPSVAWRIQRMM